MCGIDSQFSEVLQFMPSPDAGKLLHLPFRVTAGKDEGLELCHMACLLEDIKDSCQQLSQH